MNEEKFSTNIRFLKPTLYDKHGKEIENPICDVCGNYKNMIMGKEKTIWFCMECQK